MLILEQQLHVLLLYRYLHLHRLLVGSYLLGDKQNLLHRHLRLYWLKHLIRLHLFHQHQLHLGQQHRLLCYLLQYHLRHRLQQ